MSESKELLTFLSVLFGAGGAGVAIVGAIRDWTQKRRTQISSLDANMLTVGLARDQLAADNDRLRRERGEDAARHAADRAEWAKERAEMRAEIDALEAKLRDMLDELVELRLRSARSGDGPPAGRTMGR